MSIGSDGTAGIQEGYGGTIPSLVGWPHSPLMVSSADWMHLVRTE